MMDGSILRDEPIGRDPQPAPAAAAPVPAGARAPDPRGSAGRGAGGGGGGGGAAAGESVSPEMRGALAMLVMVLSVIVLLLMRRPVLARMGARNFVRRKGNTALVVGGLMVGTAIISASLVVGDTMDTFVSGFVLDALHTTDEVIAAEGPTGQDAFFSSVLYDEMETNISSLGTVDGGSPQIPGRISVLG